MNWLDRLALELTKRGVTGRERTRIILELRDHIESEPGSEARLGDPRALAVTFVDELATSRTRRAAGEAFAALALAAIALIVSQLAIGSAGGYPGFANGLSLFLAIPALFGMFIAPQVALVAGTLAALRAVKRRRMVCLPAAELALIRRRTRVGLSAGFATVAGLELYVINFSSVLPAWWLLLIGGLAAIGGLALFAARARIARVGALVSDTPGLPGDVYDDLPFIGWSWMRGRPWRLGAVASLIVGLGMALVEAHAEHSLIEGVQRGLFEGLAAGVGFLALGRAIGVTTPVQHPGVAELPSRPRGRRGETLAVAPRQLVSDQDRIGAERALGESFAHGRLSIEELTERLAAVHAARTADQLRAALGDLPDNP